MNLWVQQTKRVAKAIVARRVRFVRVSPYWRTYWGQGLTVVGAVLFFLGAASWAWSSYQSSLGVTQNLKNTVEPILAMLAAIFSLPAASIVRRLVERRSKEPTPPLEELEDQSCNPWRAINHSYHRIEWTPEIPRRIKKHLIDFYLLQHPGWSTRMQIRLGLCVFERLCEETGTENFRVLRWMQPTEFLRLYKSVDEGDLACREMVLLHLLQTGVFTKAAAACLVPVTIKSGRRNHGLVRVRDSLCRFPAGTIADEPWEIQMFAYADFDDHFSGETLYEISSVAAVLGRLQSSLAASPDRLARDVHFTQQLRLEHQKTGGAELSAEKLQARFMAMERDIATRISEGVVPGLTAETIDEVRLVVERCAYMRQRYFTEPTFVLLHDVHPQNVFFRAFPFEERRECELIYDFHWAGKWNHSVVLAFAMHRFVREFVRRSSAPNPGDSIRKGVRAFLSSYQEFCKLPIASDFQINLDGYILCGNVEKLLNSLERSLKRASDDLKRSDARLTGEVRKFLRFRAEAEAFGEAMQQQFR